MLPSFVSSGGTVQNHIHLGLVPYDGSSPVGFGPYGEPPYRFGHAQKRAPDYELVMTFQRTWLGRGVHQSLRTADKTRTQVFKGFTHDLRVTLPELEILDHLLGNMVYFVDHVHCNDGVSHTPFVRTVLFYTLSYGGNLDPLLEHNVVTVQFKDMDTVS